jgi:hypothetical protein
MRKKIKVKKFFKGAQADASAGKSPMSPGTSVTGGVRSGPSNANTNTNVNLGNNKTNVKDSGNKAFNTVFPFTPLGFAITGLKTVENLRRAKRAKGEFYTSRKKELPINRDFYRINKRPLDTKIGSKDEPYMKEAGIIGFKKPTPVDDKPLVCPVGFINQNGVCVKIDKKGKGGFASKYYKGLL